VRENDAAFGFDLFDCGNFCYGTSLPRYRGDYGAGSQPYRPFFAGIGRYRAADFYDTAGADDVILTSPYNLPLADASADWVVSFQVLEHVPDPARYLRESRRVLRPGAQLAYVVGDQASYLRVMIRTGQLLAGIAESLGYEVVSLDLFRTRLATATKEQLREEVVVLRWPGGKRIGVFFRMAFENRSLLQNPPRTPPEPAKMNGQCDSRQPSSRRRTASHPQWNLVRHANRQRNRWPPVRLQQSLVNLQNEIVLQPGTALPVAARSLNRELPGSRGLNLQIEVKSYGNSVEAGAKIGRGGRQSQQDRVLLQSLAHPALPFSAASTAVGVASTTCALRCKLAISASRPALSSALSRVPRWKSMV